MRLFVNTKEIETLKKALDSYAEVTYSDGHDPEWKTALRLLERVELCERMQDNVNKSVESGENEVEQIPMF